jgi:predicted  nucleic acid-binding Zn-ribbon protein
MEKRKKLIIVIVALVVLLALTLILLTRKQEAPAEDLLENVSDSDEVDDIEKDFLILEEGIEEIDDLFKEIETDLDNL